jgi:ferredoxin
MAIKITEDCINCGACEPECPNHAIYEMGTKWSIADGTNVTGIFVMKDGSIVEAKQQFVALSGDYYYVVPDKCTECQGFHESPQCASVCPVDCCQPDESWVESTEQLLAKKQLLHA